MTKLAKYLKPFKMLIIFAVIFLFIQAMAELSLPDYMADIVNKGIQQGGITEATPEAMRKSLMDKIKIFMNEEEKKEVSNNYIFIDESNKNYDDYLEEYPNLAESSIYVLKDIDDEKIEYLNSIIGRALVTVSGIEQIQNNAKGGVIEFNGTEIPADTDIYDIIENLPTNQRQEIDKQMNERIDALGEDMLIQSAVGAVKAEYSALGMDVDKIQTNYILKAGLKMLLVALISAISIVIVGFLASKTAAGLARNLRYDVFTHVERFSIRELDKFSSSSLITRTTNDITQIQNLIVIMIRMVFFAPIMGIGGVIKAIGKSASMSWIIGVAVIALLGLVSILIIVVMPKFKIVQKLIDKLNLVTRENLSGMMVIRAFSNQEFEENRFDKANKKLTNTNLFINRVMALMYPAMMLIMNGVTILIVWVGAHRIADANMQVGDMMAYMQYAMQIIFAFLMMSMMFILIPRASVSANRIVEVLDTELEIKDPENPKEFDNSLKGVVEFKNVSFRYDGAEEDMLKNIDFEALPGETTAIIGSTGSGKTTLLNLIPRFQDVTSGEILVDGVDIRKVSQHDLREKIGYVPQKSILFSGTIESNLKYGDEDAEKEDLIKAAEISQSMEFIKEKEEEFRSPISQGGSNVSGGQKQRLSIARALMKKPEIFLFDDSFSALDFKTDSALRKALNERIENSTIIIVAQRVASIMNAEQIIVLDEGEIVGKGKHRELLRNCKPYREIAESQLSKEELA
ncbi:ABC transporter ATP-binding protein [Senegalia massiliensis]|uniref:ABC transporter ATP-binding protein n=1 Tax=Senegalia massiliensis TaxID=1720316 RepID=A0A845QXY1_9CLOT|nr:ABC transporter ATP-binding protein [Senegalia massiliensis]NBI05998.1 ABC transporter ATP-binding protein [Senegalia massiliensis]